MSLDIFMVVCDRDIKLLRLFLLSYKLFCGIPGLIHLLIWKKDLYLLDQIDSPSNLIVHYKDNVVGLGEDDFRNQMYLKLHADEYAKTDWIWIVDADFLICDQITIEDLFPFDSSPKWFYSNWRDVTEKSWRAPTESFLEREIPYSFMEEPQYLLNRSVLAAMRQECSVSSIISTAKPPSEFIAYGAFAYKRFNDYYDWVDSTSDDMVDCIFFRVNQKPPTYLVLNDSCEISVIGSSKIAIFWSHWDRAEQKMSEFLKDAQVRNWGYVKESAKDEALYIKTSVSEIRLNGLNAWGACYSDGWMKRASHGLIQAEQGCTLEIDLECLARNDATPVTLNIRSG